MALLCNASGLGTGPIHALLVGKILLSPAQACEMHASSYAPAALPTGNSNVLVCDDQLCHIHVDVCKQTWGFTMYCPSMTSHTCSKYLPGL